MSRPKIDREAADADRTDPQRAVASLQGIAAAWLLVLAAGCVAVLPTALNVAEHSVVRTAQAARLEISALAHKVPGGLLARHPNLSHGSTAGEAFASALALPLSRGAL